MNRPRHRNLSTSDTSLDVTQYVGEPLYREPPQPAAEPPSQRVTPYDVLGWVLVAGAVPLALLAWALFAHWLPALLGRH